MPRTTCRVESLRVLGIRNAMQEYDRRADPCHPHLKTIGSIIARLYYDSIGSRAWPDRQFTYCLHIECALTYYWRTRGYVCMVGVRGPAGGVSPSCVARWCQALEGIPPAVFVSPTSVKGHISPPLDCSGFVLVAGSYFRNMSL